MLPLDRTATLAQIVAEHGVAAPVFQRREIDCFRRGAATVAEACRDLHLDPDEVFAQLEAAITAAPRRDDPRQLPDAALVTHIVERHHAYERSALPYIVSLLSKVAGFYGKRNAKLSALCDAGHELADTLDAHLEEEERGLFPALLAGAPRSEVVRGELEEMNRHHCAVALLLARIRWLADGFAAPEWGGRSYQVLMEELEALEEDVMEHMRLENYVLFPRLSSRCQEAC